MPQGLNPEAAESAEDREFESSFSQAASSAPPPAAPAPAPADAVPPAQPPASPSPLSSQPFVPALRPAAAPVAPTSPAAAPAAPQVNPLFADAARFGIKTEDIKTDADLAKALMAHLQSVNPYAEVGRRHLATPPQPAAPAAPASPPEKEWSLDDHFAEQWKVPAWNPQFDAAIERGLVALDPETGLYVAADPRMEATVLPLLAPMNEAHIARAEARQALFNGNPLRNFHDALYPAIERQIMAKVEEIVGQRFNQVEETDAFATFEDANRAWLYNEQGEFTEHGQRFGAALADFAKAGINDPSERIQYALKLCPPPAAAPAVPPAQPGAPAPAQPTPQETFLNSALDRARHSPQSHGHLQSTPHAPVTVEEAELETLFSRQLASA